MTEHAVEGTTSRIQPAAGASRSLDPERSGSVAVAGYFEQESGIGGMARALGAVLTESGEDWGAVVRHAGDGLAREHHPFAPPTPTHPPDLLVACENADSLPVSYASGAFGALADLPAIGYWAWEVEGIPNEYATTAERLEEVWALSSFAAASIGAQVGRPVYAVPPVVTVPSGVDRDAARRALNLEPGFMVALVYDALSGATRKNPFAAVDAYCQAFRPEDGATFLIKMTNGKSQPDHFEELQNQIAGRSDIVIHNGYLDVDDHALVVQAADVYLSLHHAEGFGFTLAEAMAAGTPVIATGWSGNLEFMNSSNSYPVRWASAAVPPEASPLYPPGARWVDPEIEHAAHLLRQAFDDPTAAARMGARARASIQASHTPVARAPLVAQRLRAARERTVRASDLLDGLIDSFDQPMAVDGPARFDAVARTWRTGVARGLQHYDEHQRQRFRAVVESIRALEVHRDSERLEFERRAALLDARQTYTAQMLAASR